MKTFLLKHKFLVVLLSLVLLGGLLYAGPSILQIYQGGTGQSSFSAGLLRSSGTALSSSELSGDATTSGSNAVSVVRVNGAALPTSASYVGTNSAGQIISASTPSGGCSLSNGVNAQTSSYTLLSGDAGKLVTFNGSSLTATLPSSPPSSTWCARIQNLNSTSLTVSRNGLTINGGTSNLTLLQYQTVTCVTDGSNYFCTRPLAAGTNVTITENPQSESVAASSGGGGGSGTPGPAFNYVQCSNFANLSSSSSISCTGVSVAVGDTAVMLCDYFTNDGGTVTLSGADSLGNSPTTDATYYSTAEGGRLSVIRFPITTAGTADTFTCTPSAAKGFPQLGVYMMTGYTGVDITAGSQNSTSGSSNINLISQLTPMSDNDLMFVIAETSNADGSCTAAGFRSGAIDLVQNGTNGHYLGVKKLAKAGFYSFLANNCSGPQGILAVAYK